MITVIIPAYNCESYIARCIESVLVQTYTDFEVVAVNDGSCDGTLTKLLTMATWDSRIRVIDQPNSGVVMARKAAVEVASGEFLTFLDADDYLTEDALASMLEPMLREDADICVAAYTLEWEGTGHRKTVSNVATFGNAIGCMRYCLRHGEMFLPIKLYRTELYRRTVDIPFNVILQEDAIGLTQYLGKVRKAVYTPKSVYVYYKHAGTVTTGMTVRHGRSLLTVATFLGHSNFMQEIPRAMNLYRVACLKNCLRVKELTETERNRAFELLASIPVSIRLRFVCKQNLKNILGPMKRFALKALRK